MLRVHGCVKLAPLENSHGYFSHSCVDRLSIFGLPDDEGVVLTNASKEFIIRAELQFQNLVLNATKYSHWLLGLHVPENDGSIWSPLEDCALLACRNDVT